MANRIMAALCIASALLLGACASDPRSDYPSETVLQARDEAVLGGEALSQRKLKLERANADMGNFLQTLLSMKARGTDESSALYRGFLDRYLATHLEPLLAAKWQSNHPELITYDANLRFIQSRLLTELAYKRWAKDVLTNLGERYKERGNMLVSYPTGEQSTLRDALSIAREDVWMR
jgi:hypothetical protein